jgi:hypothetical protein
MNERCGSSPLQTTKLHNLKVHPKSNLEQALGFVPDQAPMHCSSAAYTKKQIVREPKNVGQCMRSKKVGLTKQVTLISF